MDTRAIFGIPPSKLPTFHVNTSKIETGRSHEQARRSLPALLAAVFALGARLELLGTSGHTKASICDALQNFALSAMIGSHDVLDVDMQLELPVEGTKPCASH